LLDPDLALAALFAEKAKCGDVPALRFTRRYRGRRDTIARPASNPSISRLMSLDRPHKWSEHRPAPIALDRPLSATALTSMFSDMTLKARVRKGRLVVDEPTDLPEGTEIELLPMDPGDWLDEEDRAALHRALAASDADIEAGRLMDAAEVLRELRSK